MSMERSVLGSVGPQGPQGLQGDPGEQGEQGPPGAGGAGSVIRAGDGPPSDATGEDTDIWIDRLNGDLYRRDSGVYVFQLNVKGPPGEAGESGAPGTTGASVGTYPVSSPTLAWVSGLTFRLGAGVYFLDGTLTSSDEQEITLDAADATFDRFDVIVLDAAGDADVIAGTPSSAPAIPTVDQTTYFPVTTVQVPAGATEVPLTSTTLYAEGAGGEWSASASAGTVSIGSTSNPRSGTKDIEGTAVVSGTTVTLTIPAGTLDVATKDKLIAYVRIKSAWPTKKALAFRWLEGTVQRGATVTVGNGLYGLNTQSVGAYQQVVIPLSAFSVPAGSAITKLELAVVGSGSSIGFYLDDLSLQAGAAASQGAPFRFRGEWDPGAGYDQNDVVTRTGSTYVGLQPNTGKPPCWNSGFWTRFGPPVQTATTVYVDGASGSDTTGDGRITHPYATVARAIAQLPEHLYRVYTINVADGTYAEGIEFSRFTCGGAGQVVILGDTTTPANVTFTGTVSVLFDNMTGFTTGVLAQGAVRVKLSGLRVNTTAVFGVWALEDAILFMDRCVTAGTLALAVGSWFGAKIVLMGNNTIAGWTSQGIQQHVGGNVRFGSAGTVTITGPGTTGTGWTCGGGSRCLNLAEVDHSIVITGVQFGIHCDFNSSFSFQPPSGSITIDNVTTPGSSRAILCNDHGNFSTNKALTIDHFTVGFEANSQAYIEYVLSTLTQTNIGTLESEPTGGLVNAV